MHLPVRQRVLQRRVGVAHELLPNIVQAVQRVGVVARDLVYGHVGGDAVPDSVKTVQGVPHRDLVDAVVGALGVWFGWWEIVLFCPCVREDYDSGRCGGTADLVLWTKKVPQKVSWSGLLSRICSHSSAASIVEGPDPPSPFNCQDTVYSARLKSVVSQLGSEIF